MTENHITKDTPDLDALFTQARAERVVPGPDLMARILADAVRATADRGTAPRSAPVPGFLTGLWSVLGGWSGAGGLAAVTAAGLWIGVSPPQGFDSLTTALFGATESVSVFAVDDVLGTEG